MAWVTTDRYGRRPLASGEPRQVLSFTLLLGHPGNVGVTGVSAWNFVAGDKESSYEQQVNHPASELSWRMCDQG